MWYNADMQTKDLEQFAASALIIQGTPRGFITVRDAAVAWHMSIGAAHAILIRLVYAGKAEKQGEHYHIKETE